MGNFRRDFFLYIFPFFFAFLYWPAFFTKFFQVLPGSGAFGG